MIRSPRLIALLAALALTLAGCAAPQAAPAPAGQPTAGTEPRGGSLTRALTSEPASLDPQGAANAGLNVVLPFLYDTLITRQRDGKFVPNLASSWQVAPDGKSIDLKLKSGVKFQDGTPLNAAAVVFTFERFKKVGDKSPIAANVKQIDKITAVDDSTVKMTFTEPNASIFGTLSMPYSGIMSPAAVQAAGDDLSVKSAGSGPFKLGEWKRGVGITLTRNPDYNWGPAEVKNKGPVYLDSVVLKVVPDASTQMAALQAGDVDMIFVTEPSQLTQAQADTSLHIEPINLDSLIYLGFNCAKAPYDDVKVRQALAYAVNKPDVVKTALGGLGIEAGTPLPPGLLGYDKSLASSGQGYDPARAKALLAEAGFTQGADGSWQKAGVKLGGRLLTSNRAPNEAIATLLQSQFKAIGVPLEIQQLDSSAVMKASTEGAFDLILWRYDWNDPDALNIYLGSSRIRQTNRVFYSNKDADALFAAGLKEFDPDKRARIYQDAQKLILKDAPWQPLYYPMEGLVYRGRVNNLVIGSLGRVMVNDATVK
ncbi:MAG TPA: ABC transporter substrate-binding protein [Chloroflexota bacterium]